MGSIAGWRGKKKRLVKAGREKVAITESKQQTKQTKEKTNRD